MAVSVAAVGNVNDISTWSGTSYYFFNAGKRAGLFDHPWELDLNKFKWNRYSWNLWNVIKGKGIGGYQFSNEFLNRAEAEIPSEYFKETIISFNQLFPRSKTVVNYRGKIYRYIDATLFDLMNEPTYKLSFSEKDKGNILELERQNYVGSEKVVIMASWVKKSLIEFYKIPEDKILSILPGANISFGHPGFNQDNKKDSPFVLGFVGKDWERKGLPLVIELADRLHGKAINVEVKVIGGCPDHISTLPFVNYLGFIDKYRDSDRFISELASCHIGCFFSRSEAMGIAPLEFIRMGIPAIGYAHQGLKDALLPEASIRVSVDDKIEAIEAKLMNCIKNKEVYKRLIDSANGVSNYVSWERCIDEWKEILKNE